MLGQREGTIIPKELTNAGFYYADIQKLMEEGAIEKLPRGIYRLNDNEDASEAALFNRLFPEVILCLETELFYYGYSDRMPSIWNLAVNKDVKKFVLILTTRSSSLIILNLKVLTSGRQGAKLTATKFGFMTRSAPSATA